ncbi:hypothetical protein Tco_0753675 [Tanacetum coccineum]
MERFKNALFKQREEINGRMAEMFGLLKELTTSRTPEKVLIREEANPRHQKRDRSKGSETRNGVKLGTNASNQRAEKEEAGLAPSSQTVQMTPVQEFGRKMKISFHRIPESFCKFEKGIKNDIEPIALTMTVNRLVLEWEEKDKTSPGKGDEVRPMEEQKLQK